MYLENKIVKRDWEKEQTKRTDWIKSVVKEAEAKGAIIGLSGGKDSSIVAALLVKALGKDNVLGIIMPCNSKNPKDEIDAKLLAEKLDIKVRKVDLTSSFDKLYKDVGDQSSINLSDISVANIKPRLRMITLYTIGQTLGYLVVGTGNRSEAMVGYCTKWGDAACDFNPIADLTVTELFEFGRFLGIPHEIIDKAPSAGLWEGQTDEKEMGITYKALDEYILYGTGKPETIEKIKFKHKITEHKRLLPKTFK